MRLTPTSQGRSLLTFLAVSIVKIVAGSRGKGSQRARPLALAGQAPSPPARQTPAPDQHPPAWQHRLGATGTQGKPGHGRHSVAVLASCLGRRRVSSRLPSPLRGSGPHSLLWVSPSARLSTVSHFIPPPTHPDSITTRPADQAPGPQAGHLPRQGGGRDRLVQNWAGLMPRWSSDAGTVTPPWSCLSPCHHGKGTATCSIVKTRLLRGAAGPGLLVPWWPPGASELPSEAGPREGPAGAWVVSECSVPLCPQDAFQEEYYRTGTFPETPMVPPRRPWTLLNWLFWASLLLYPFFRFLVSMVSSGSSLTLASFVLVFFVGRWRAKGKRLAGALGTGGVQAEWGPLSTTVVLSGEKHSPQVARKSRRQVACAHTRRPQAGAFHLLVPGLAPSAGRPPAPCGWQHGSPQPLQMARHEENHFPGPAGTDGGGSLPSEAGAGPRGRRVLLRATGTAVRHRMEAFSP